MTDKFIVVQFLDQHRVQIVNVKDGLPDYAEPTGRTIDGLEEYVVGTLAEKKAFLDNINMV